MAASRTAGKARKPATQRRARLPHTPMHTLGPFYPFVLIGEHDHDLTFTTDPDNRARGERILIEGRVFEKNRVPRINTLVEIWQADAAGTFAHPADPGHAGADADFMGWGRCKTDREGRFRFVTVKPDGYQDPLTGTRRAPHINLMISSSGLMNRLVTTLFFPDEPDNAHDVVLNAVRNRARRERLIARHAAGWAKDRQLDFDIILRGPDETPFFAD
ncbi:MAG: protocatechuate 3,4-dioxygenase subunit alpha [Betaproteobacteria bacterium]|nr:protocatechuate 3,4-dioxygenase subunit alpha [Betaproteobacteria bacterium]